MRTAWATDEVIEKKWLLVDAEGQTLGRFASGIAKIIRGKNKTYFSPNLDCGDNVIVINAEKIKLSGKKLTDKKYFTYSNYPGGQRVFTPEKLLEKTPERILEHAVRGMLPKNRLGRKLFSKLHVCIGGTHKFQAQSPVEYKIPNK